MTPRVLNDANKHVLFRMMRVILHLPRLRAVAVPASLLGEKQGRSRRDNDGCYYPVKILRTTRDRVIVILQMYRVVTLPEYSTRDTLQGLQSYVR